MMPGIVAHIYISQLLPVGPVQRKQKLFHLNFSRENAERREVPTAKGRVHLDQRKEGNGRCLPFAFSRVVWLQRELHPLELEAFVVTGRHLNQPRCGLDRRRSEITAGGCWAL